ncbi:MAG: DUF6268 family outer membrane beta-barrel protein [Nibricoccus sp.]
MNIRALLATIVSASLGSIAFGQSELMPETGPVGLTLQARASATAQQKLKAGNTTYEDVSGGSVEIGVAQTFRLAPGRTLRVSIEELGVSIDQKRDAGEPVVPLPDELNAVSAALGYTHVLNPQWILTGRVGAGSYVTDSGLLSEGWAGSAMAMAIYNHSKEVTYVFGIGYNSNLENLRVLPIFGLNWRPAPQWSVAVGFPRTAVSYHFNKNLSLGLALSGAGGAYYVAKDPQPGVAARSLADTRLQQREIRLGVDVQWKINPTFRVSGSVGQVLYRRFEYMDRDFELKSKGVAPYISVAGSISL